MKVRVGKIDSFMPPSTLLEDARLLTDAGLQKTFYGIVNKNKIGELTSELGQFLSTVRLGSSVGLEIKECSRLGALLIFGKRCCGVQSVLLALSPKELPKAPAELPAYVAALELRLRKKGIGNGPKMVPLPAPFAAALAGLKGAAASA